MPDLRDVGKRSHGRCADLLKEPGWAFHLLTRTSASSPVSETASIEFDSRRLHEIHKAFQADASQAEGNGKATKNLAGQLG